MSAWLSLVLLAVGADDIVTHELESEFQPGKTLVRVLQPTSLPADKRLRVVYVLPVEASVENRYGDGLAEIHKRDLHNKYGVLFAAPTFAQLPWYSDHPADRAVRQESHFLRAVIPFVEKHYPAQADSDSRLLLGFSKSGWGAWSLLLRHPKTFGRAAAWDAPLMMDAPGKYGSGPIFGDAQNFAAYQVSKLARERGGQLGAEPRLILTGYGNFRREHEGMHAHLDELKLPHVYRDGPERKHDWHSGWVAEAVALLLARSGDER